MTDILARGIADSIADRAERCLTIETRSPTMVHQEVLRHRRIICEEGLSMLDLGWDPDFSYSVSSTRAVPFVKLLEECRNPALAAAPVHWGRAAKGMVPTVEEIDDTIKDIYWPEVYARFGFDYVVSAEWITRREAAKRIWDMHGQVSARMAEVMVEVADPHKSIPNRMMAPHTHYNVLMSGTAPGWLNFLGLRLDKAADPIVRALAEKCWIVWNESQPKTLKPGIWHLPYADDDQSFEEVHTALNTEPLIYEMGNTAADQLIILQKMSVARCAHLSYTSFETGERMTVPQCVNLYGRLVGSVPIHASPAEHQATPDSYTIMFPDSDHEVPAWRNGGKGGNFGPGWVQLRKLLPNEAVAPLPEGYA